MPKINVEKLDDQKKLNILKKSVEKHGLSYVSRFVGVDRSTLNRYLNGKIQRIPQEVVEKASELLTVDELSDVVYGLRSTDVDPTTAISVIIKAKKDEGFRNFFLSLLWQELGDYIKEPMNSYLVTKDDIELFEKMVRNEKSRKTAEERVNYLRRALADLDYELTPTKLKEYILDLSEESFGVLDIPGVIEFADTGRVILRGTDELSPLRRIAERLGKSKAFNIPLLGIGLSSTLFSGIKSLTSSDASNNRTHTQINIPSSDETFNKSQGYAFNSLSDIENSIINSQNVRNAIQTVTQEGSHMFKQYALYILFIIITIIGVLMLLILKK